MLSTELESYTQMTGQLVIVSEGGDDRMCLANALATIERGSAFVARARVNLGLARLGTGLAALF